MTSTLDRQVHGSDTATEQLLVVSADSHVGPPIEDLREYCPKQYLDDFDDFQKAFLAGQVESAVGKDGKAGDALATSMPPGCREVFMEMLDDKLLHYDPHYMLRNMDGDGIAVQVIYHGALNGNPIPFLSTLLFGSGKPRTGGGRDHELAAAGMRIYNRWLADYCSVAPDRFIGLAQLPMWDPDIVVAEVEFARSVGLRGLNFPAPRPFMPDYNELVWEPFYSAAESLDMTLNTHGGSPVTAELASYAGVDGGMPFLYESVIFARRALPFMIFGGVFDRHPNLRLLFTEHPSEWVESTLHDLDGLWAWSRVAPMITRKPSEYFFSNCYVGVSFMSNSEAKTAVQQGTTENMVWGSDYPHLEGTWPDTRLSLRKTMEGVPADAIRAMLGRNAVKAFGLDLNELAPIVAKIGPTLEEIMTPLDPADVPDRGKWTMAFRDGTSWS